MFTITLNLLFLKIFFKICSNFSCYNNLKTINKKQTNILLEISAFGKKQLSLYARLRYGRISSTCRIKKNQKTDGSKKNSQETCLWRSSNPVKSQPSEYPQTLWVLFRSWNDINFHNPRIHLEWKLTLTFERDTKFKLQTTILPF